MNIVQNLITMTLTDELYRDTINIELFPDFGNSAEMDITKEDAVSIIEHLTKVFDLDGDKPEMPLFEGTLDGLSKITIRGSE